MFLNMVAYIFIIRYYYFPYLTNSGHKFNFNFIFLVDYSTSEYCIGQDTQTNMTDIIVYTMMSVRF